MSVIMIERTCVDSRCNYGRHDQVHGHMWADEEHMCNPWPDWTKCDLRHLATEALYRYDGRWTGPAAMSALHDLIDAPDMAASTPAEIVAEFARRGQERQS